MRGLRKYNYTFYSLTKLEGYSVFFNHLHIRLLGTVSQYSVGQI